MAGEELFNTFVPLLEGLVYILAGLFIFAIVGGGIWLWWRNLRYKNHVLVYDASITGGGFYTTKGGAFVDSKTKNKLYYLKNDKSENGTYSWPRLQCTVNSPATMHVSAGDVDVNAALNHYDHGVKSFNNTLDKMQIVVYSVFGIVVIGILVMMIFLFKKFDVFVDVAAAMNSVADKLSVSGTTVVAGG